MTNEQNSRTILNRRCYERGKERMMAGYEHGGWVQKYRVEKVNGNLVDPKAEYFVLRFDKDAHARVAMAAYADSVESVNPEFAEDIRKKIRPYNRLAATSGERK